MDGCRRHLPAAGGFLASVSFPALFFVDGATSLAAGIVLVLATQRPDKESLPTGVSGNVSIRFCLHVAGQVENDMILGTSAYKNGYRATMFRPGVEAGSSASSFVATAVSQPQ